MLVIAPLWVVPESVEAQIGLSLWMRKSVLAAGKDSSMNMLMEMRSHAIFLVGCGEFALFRLWPFCLAWSV